MTSTVALETLLVGDTVSYGIVQPGPEFADGTPIVRVKDIRCGMIDTTKPLRVDPEIAKRFQRTVLSGGELLVTLVGTVGETAIVPEQLSTWNVARAVAVLRPETVSAQWLHYCFKSEFIQNQISAALNTTVQSTLNLSDLKSVQVPVPEAAVRDVIVKVLGALDDKISTNRRLETAAHHLAAALVDQRRWMCNPIKLSAISQSISRGIAPKYGDAGSTVINQKCIRSGTVDLDLARIAQPLPDGSPKELQRNDVLVNSTGQGTLGRIARWTRDDPGITADSHVSIVRLDAESCDPVFAGTVLSRMERHVEDLAEGSTGQTELRRDLLGSLDLPLPSLAIQKHVGHELTLLADRALAAADESRSLARTRDELLPLLMDGRITVRQAEDRAGEVL